MKLLTILSFYSLDKIFIKNYDVLILYFFNSSIASFDLPGANFVYLPDGWGFGRGFFGFVFAAASTPVSSDIPKSPSSLILF